MVTIGPGQGGQFQSVVPLTLGQCDIIKQRRIFWDLFKFCIIIITFLLLTLGVFFVLLSLIALGVKLGCLFEMF